MRMISFVKRIVRQMLNDKRTLGLMFLAPLLILALINQFLTGEPHIPKIATYNVPTHISSILSQAGASVETYHVWDEAYVTLLEGEAEAILDMSNAIPSIILEGSNPMVSGEAVRLIKMTLGGASTPYRVIEADISFVYGMEDMLLFDYAGPILIAFLAFFFVFLTAGVSFLRERTNGTLERLLGTPVKRWEIVAGYTVGLGIFALIQACIIAFFAVNVLNALMAGEIILLIMVTVLIAMSALTLGMLISSFAQNEFQIVQFIPIVVIPQLLFSGLFNLDAFPFWLRFLGYLMPVQYGVDALNHIMIRGKQLNDIVPEVMALSAFSLVFCTLNVIALKRFRSL